MTRAGVLLAVDVAVLTVRQGRLGVLAVRDSAPHHLEVADHGRDEDRGAAWQLPGAPVPADEDCDAVAEQLLLVGAGAVTGRDTMFLEQLRTYSSPRRVPGARLVSVAYVALVPELVVPSGALAASRVFAVDDLEDTGFLAFDHDTILADAIERVRAKLEYTTVATSLVTEPFTIPELRRVYESVWGVSLHPANFRRKVLATPGFVVPEADGGARRGPDLYRRGTAALLHPAMLRPAHES